MFWKSTAWTWDGAGGNHDDGNDSHLLTGDLKRTSDSVPEPDRNHAGSSTSSWSSSVWTSSSCSSVLRATLFPSSSCMTVSTIRGKDGFGFTICWDDPVRVQAVDPGGPAARSGLRQGDSVLQLDGTPVDTWTCAALAQAIRSGPSQIVMVVWRGSPEVTSGPGGWPQQLLHNRATCGEFLAHPFHSKHRCRLGPGPGPGPGAGPDPGPGPGPGVRSSLGFLGPLWRGRGEEQEEDDEEQYTTTLRGTRVTSSTGDDYIILSPVGPEGQIPGPVHRDRNGPLGSACRLYQTHPRRGQHLVLDPQRPSGGISTFPPPTSPPSSPQGPGNYGNYQNCTIVQSHRTSPEQSSEWKNHRGRTGSTSLPSPEEVLKWAKCLEALLANQYGVTVFRHFLRSEVSEENLDFWLAVERFKRTHPLSKMAALGRKIYEDFISTDAVRQVNVHSSIRELTSQSLDLGLSPASFHLAQMQVFSLMETEYYPRFLKSRLYAQLANHKAQAP